MKTKPYKYLLIPGLILLILACSKEFLETPNNATLSIENFYKTKNDLDKAITAAYSIFKASDLNDGNIVGETFTHGHFLIGNANSDDAEVGGGIGEAVDLILMSECNAQADLGLASSLWTGLYQGIYRCNLVIENTPNALDEVSDEQKAIYIAEAKFIRSYCYFHLSRVFGPVPLITAPLGSDEFYSVTRNPLNEIYHQIELDLEEAAKILPWAEQFDGHANCFIESGFGKGILIDFNYDTEPLPGKFPLPGVGPFSLLEETKMNHYGKMMFRWMYWNFLLKGLELPIESEMSMAGKRG